MPELPEVETVVRGIRGNITGKKISSISIQNRSLRFPIAAGFSRRLQDSQVREIYRRGKYILIALDSNDIWLIHLGMTGRLHFFHEKKKPQKYCCFSVLFVDSSTLQYCDVRRFGFTSVAQSHASIQKLGPEPLEANFNSRYLFESVSRRITNIKNLLLNQAIVAGLGNIYICESLYRASIHPLRTGNSITISEAGLLVKSIKQVLRKAIHNGGSSISDFLKSDGTRGSYQDHCETYNQAGKSCKRCGSKITRIAQGGRSSFFCPGCQKI